MNFQSGSQQPFALVFDFSALLVATTLIEIAVSHENWPSSYIMKFLLKEPRYNLLFNLRWALGSNTITSIDTITSLFCTDEEATHSQINLALPNVVRLLQIYLLAPMSAASGENDHFRVNVVLRHIYRGAGTGGGARPFSGGKVAF
jgi:hypothetical protein